MYLRSGFIKKFPLDKKKVSLGRLKKHELCIDEPFVSKDHAQITVFADHVEIEDLGSTNGVFVGPDQRKLLGNVYLTSQALLDDLAVQVGTQTIQQLPQVDRFWGNVHLAGLDLGDVQEILDHGRQVPS